MDNELQKQIAEVLRKAMEAAQKGGEWLAGQIPDVLRQVIYWEIATGIVSVLLFLIAMRVSFLWLTKWSSQEPDHYGDWRISKIVAAFGGGVLTAATGIPALVNGISALKAIIAPKLFLLEYVAHLLK